MTILWKPSLMRAIDHRPRAPPAPRTTAWRGIFCRPTTLSSAVLKPATSVLWPIELPAVARDDVDRAGRLGVFGQPVHHRDDVFLVGNGHVRAEEVVAAELGDRLGKVDLSPIPQLVPGVDLQGVESSLLHRTREGMGDRVADQDDSIGHARSLSSSVIEARVRDGRAVGTVDRMSSPMR